MTSWSNVSAYLYSDAGCGIAPSLYERLEHGSYSELGLPLGPTEAGPTDRQQRKA
jgi:hypothetical protein